MGETAPGHVFISYVREDTDSADYLQGLLEEAGIPVWRDTGATPVTCRRARTGAPRYVARLSQTRWCLSPVSHALASRVRRLIKTWNCCTRLKNFGYVLPGNSGLFQFGSMIVRSPTLRLAAGGRLRRSSAPISSAKGVRLRPRGLSRPFAGFCHRLTLGRARTYRPAAQSYARRSTSCQALPVPPGTG